MEKLPLEITADIVVSGIPLASQLRCREACKTWRTLVPKPKKGLLYDVLFPKDTEVEAEFYFSEQNNNHKVNVNVDDDDEHVSSCLGKLTKLDHNLMMPSSSILTKSMVSYKTFMLGSCNGLVCYSGYANSKTRERKVYICNPVTGEQIQLSTSNYDTCKEKVIGFGYNRSSNEYKVVGIIFRPETILVHTLQGDTGWRNTSYMIKKHLVSHFAVFCGSSASAGVFANGFLHWIDKSNNIIIAFDLEHENFIFLVSIPLLAGHGDNHVDLVVLGGNLCVLEVVPGKQVTIWESWYSKEYHGFVYPNWVPKFKIALEEYSWFETFALTKSDDKCLLWHNVVLSCYDHDTETLRKLDETLKDLMDDSTPSVYTTIRATPHVNILASLKAIMEETVGVKRKDHVDRDRKRKR